MLSKKHNDTLHWKNKLETLDNLPGAIATEKNALWDKLNSRLQQKPNSRKVVWYWVAAGLLPLIITLTIINRTGNVLVEHTTSNEKNTTATPAYLLPASKESVTLSVTAPVEKKQTPDDVKPKTKNVISNDTIKASEAVVTVTSLPQNQTIEITDSNILAPDTTATFAVAKKKLQVVHINELETFPAQFTAPANYAQIIKQSKSKINKLSFATQQNIIGFKVKLSSKN
jgi:hypothetical protein